MALLNDFKQFVADEQASSAYSNWRRDNSGLTAQQKKQDPLPPPTAASEAGQWFVFRDAIVAGQRPAPPALATWFGKALIDAGLLYLHAVPLDVTVTGKPQVGKTLTAVAR